MLRSARIASVCAGAVVLLVASVVGPPTAVADTASINVPVAHIEGRGHGHGVGMSQWGAYTLAAQGASAAEILATFYPGTQLGAAGGEVVVPVEQRDTVQVQFPTGGEVRSSRSGDQQPGFPVQVAPGGIVDLVRDGEGYRVVGGTVAPLNTDATAYSARQSECFLIFCPPDDGDSGDGGDGGDSGGSTTTTTPPAPDAPPPSEDDGSSGTGDGPDSGQSPTTTTTPADPTSPTPVWAISSDGGPLHAVGRGRTYRGVLEFTGGPGAARLRNHVDVEQYVKGMAEVPGNWPAAAVQAQAIAARTFALRAMAAGGEICDSESCQVYTGVAGESPGQSAAVDATAGSVVLHNGGYASTFYSASGGGVSATIAEGFGSSGDVSYLQANEYPTANPKPYDLDIALTDVAGRLGYPGTIEDIRVDEVGPSGRALRMTVTGDAGDLDVDPQDFRRRLGLRSTLFTVTTSEAEEPPPPPEEDADPGVVGQTVSTADLGAVQTVAPTRSTDRLLSSPLPTLVDDAPGPPLALVVVALAMIATISLTATAHVGSRRRLHPLFALATVVADVSGGVTRAAVRSGMRTAGATLVTMATWMLPRR
ncbi:MAG: SpoIID/LytB domain-containing protein [Acidimicrobiales bacterium]|nr:SpoIID/LytB domain-containing protein [Acidimicrobiales bacterium]